MTERQLGNLDDLTGEYRKQADIFRAASEYCNSQIQSLMEQRNLLVKLGAQFPMTMASTDFIIKQVATSTEVDDVDVSIPIPRTKQVRGRQRIGYRSRARSSTRLPTEHSGDRIKRYNISPQIKPIMNAIFSSGEELPQSLDSLFGRMYGDKWQLRTITVPLRPGAHNLTTFAEDLNSGNSYVRRLLSGADEVICVNMRNNETPGFAVRGKVAAVELIQLYHTIDGIGWGFYDDFMIRNRIRQTQVSIG